MQRILAALICIFATVQACSAGPSLEQIGEADTDQTSPPEQVSVARASVKAFPADPLTLNSQAGVTALRQQLTTFVFGSPNLPAAPPVLVPNSAVCQTSGLPNLASTQQLFIPMAPNEDPAAPQSTYACHFLANNSNSRLVVLHHGHACTFDDGTDPFWDDNSYGLRRTIYSLLSDGYSVLGVYMPHNHPLDCQGTAGHDPMLDFHPTPGGSSLQYFLEPTARALTFVQNSGRYLEYNMIGLSGGGWTTVWYAALDTRIKTSINVAGSMPFPFWPADWTGDDEQTWPPYYTATGYRHLYVLGAHGAGRRQIHVLNRNDGCCFNQNWNPVNGLPWETNVRQYERDIRSALVNMGSTGMLRIEIDETPNVHTVSRNAVTNVIRAELEGARLHAGAVDASDAFVRGANDNMWRFSGSSWADSGLGMVGVPAVVHVSGSGQHSVDLFYRDGSNQLRRAWPAGAGFTSVSLGGVIISDPAAVSRGPGIWDVVAFGGDYRLYHWSSAFSGFQLISSTAMGLGTPSLVTAGSTSLDIFFRGLGDGVYRLGWNGTTWSLDSTMQTGAILGFPAAVVTTGPVRRVYAYGHDNLLYENSKSGTGAWSNWVSVSGLVGQTGTLLGGTPTAAASGSTVKVATRTLWPGNLAIFTRGSNWSFANLGGGIAGAPTAVPTGAWVQGAGNNLWFNSGSGWSSKGGWFE